MTPPTPTEVRAARKAAGLTQAAAAALIHSEGRAWRQWESPPEDARNHRRMHPGLWLCFRLRVAGAKLPEEETP